MKMPLSEWSLIIIPTLFWAYFLRINVKGLVPLFTFNIHYLNWNEIMNAVFEMENIFQLIFSP